MNDFIIEIVKTGRGRYQTVRHILHLTECKKKTPRAKRVPLTESVWFASGEAYGKWGDKPRGPWQNEYFSYQSPEVCEWCMNPRTTAMARATFWLFVVKEGRERIAGIEAARVERLKEYANKLERTHPYTSLLKAVREAWIDGDTAPNPDPKRAYNRRNVEWKWDRDLWFTRPAPEYVEFRLSNIHWSDVIRIKCVPEGDGVRVDDVNHSTSAICEPKDAHRLSAVFTVIENWTKEAQA